MGDETILDHPELLELKYAVYSAVWFWDTNKLNKCADHDDIEACTRAVNGKAMLGLSERTKYYLIAKELLSDN
jgi:putative chitinase